MKYDGRKCNTAGSVKANGREPKTGLGWVFNFKLGCLMMRIYLFTWTQAHIYSWKLTPGLVLLA